VVVFDNFRLEFVGMNTKNVTLNEGYATFSSVDAYRIDTEGVNAYKVTAGATTGVVTLQALSDGIPGNTGVVLYGEGKTSVQLTAVTTSGSDTEGNLMKANVDDYNLPSSVVINEVTYNNYTLGKDVTDNRVKFLRSNGEGTLAAGKAYLQLPASAGSRVSILFPDDEVTSVDGKGIAKGAKEPSVPVYNLQGQRVLKPTKGLFIVDGKKHVVR